MASIKINTRIGDSLVIVPIDLSNIHQNYSFLSNIKKFSATLSSEKHYEIIMRTQDDEEWEFQNSDVKMLVWRDGESYKGDIEDMVKLVNTIYSLVKIYLRQFKNSMDSIGL